MDMHEFLSKHYGNNKGRVCQWNVISVGDSLAEQNALKELIQEKDAEALKNKQMRPFCKTVHLMDEPTMGQLGDELRILMVWLSKLVQLRKNFDVDMTNLDGVEHELFQKL